MHVNGSSEGLLYDLYLYAIFPSYSSSQPEASGCPFPVGHCLRQSWAASLTREAEAPQVLTKLASRLSFVVKRHLERAGLLALVFGDVIWSM